MGGRHPLTGVVMNTYIQAITMAALLSCGLPLGVWAAPPAPELAGDEWEAVQDELAPASQGDALDPESYMGEIVVAPSAQTNADVVSAGLAQLQVGPITNPAARITQSSARRNSAVINQSVLR